MKRLELTVPPQQDGQRLDRFLSAACTDCSRTALQKAIASGAVTVNGRPAAKSMVLSCGDSVFFAPPEPVELAVCAQNIPLDIVYEDADLLVVNKPKGMVVHPAPGNPDGTLVNALLYHCKGSLSGINGVLRPGIVHRIDKDTSGLLMVAKTDFAHRSLAAQIAAHSFTREYRAIAVGHLRELCGTVDAPIGRDSRDRKKMAVTQKNGKAAVTHYETLALYTGYSALKLRLETGRTHQIRVHMAYLGHPLAGDTVYGHPKKNELSLCGQCLHAGKIGFVHPRTDAYLEFESPLPAYFQAFQRSLTLEYENPCAK